MPANELQGETLKYPSEEQHLAWYAEFQKLQAPRMFSLKDYGEFLAVKVADWQREQDAKTAAVIAEKNREWSGTYRVAKSIESAIRSGGSHDRA